MRRLPLIMAVLTTVMCSVGDLQAFEIKHKFTISPLGGVAVPIGDLADDDSSNAKAGGAKTGYNIGLALEYGITEQVLVGGRFAYNRFEVDREFLEQALRDSIGDYRAHWTVIEILGVYGKLLLLPGSSTRPYVRGGLFLGKPKLAVDGNGESWSRDFDVSLGFDAGIGVTHMFSEHIGIGIEGRFAHLGPNETDFDPVDEVRNLAAGAHTPNGVRDPGGNIQLLALSASVTYVF